MKNSIWMTEITDNLLAKKSALNLVCFDKEIVCSPVTDNILKPNFLVLKPFSKGKKTPTTCLWLSFCVPDEDFVL